MLPEQAKKKLLGGEYAETLGRLHVCAGDGAARQAERIAGAVDRKSVV